MIQGMLRRPFSRGCAVLRPAILSLLCLCAARQHASAYSFVAPIVTTRSGELQSNNCYSQPNGDSNVMSFIRNRICSSTDMRAAEAAAAHPSSWSTRSSFCRPNFRPSCPRPFPLAENGNMSGRRSLSRLRVCDVDGVDREGGDSAGHLAEGDTLGAHAAQVLAFWQNRRPNPDLPVGRVIGLLMAALQRNDYPTANDGLRTVFGFSSGMCRRAVGSTADRFISQARVSRWTSSSTPIYISRLKEDTFSITFIPGIPPFICQVFGATIGCQSYTLDPLQIVVNVTAADGRTRRFLWTLERQRRPPDTGKWLVYGVVSSDVDGTLTLEG